MPTPLPSLEKAAFINIVKVAAPQEGVRLPAILNNYEDIVTAIGRSGPLFEENNSFLLEAIGCFSSDAALNTVGIYRNGTTTTLVNPAMLINYHVTTSISFTANTTFLTIFGTSTVKLISVSASVKLGNMYVGPGATVDGFDSSASGASVGVITLASARSQNATLNYATLGSRMGGVDIMGGSYFGGMQSIDPTAACAIPVTGLQAFNVTKNSIKLLWTPPTSGYLFINIYIRKNGESVWNKITSSAQGDYISNVGFLFKNLEEDTYYDFKVDVICNNGGIAPTTLLNKTTGIVNLPASDECLFYVTIKTTPGSSTIPLCDGTLILAEYPEGPTLTIPQLIGRHIKTDVVINRITWQKFPYDINAGVLNAAPLEKQNFVDGDIVSITIINK